MLTRRLAGLVGAFALAVSGISVLSAVPAAAAAGDPAQNVPPSPNFWVTCSIHGASSAECASDELAAINHARSLEGVGSMLLPGGFSSMSTAEQTFVLSNLERVDRGLQPAAGTVAVLNSSAQTGANNDADPVLSSWTIGSFSANRYGSIWAGDLYALAADYDWMYNDGWSPSGSYNLDCQSASAAGCWGHRHNIIGSYGGERLITGVASKVESQWTSMAQIFVAGSGNYPPFVTTWADAAHAAAVIPPNTSTPPTLGQDGTTTSIATTTKVAAGHTASVTGKLLDSTTGLPLANTGVLLCHRAATASTGACQSTVTDGSGLVRLTTRPLVRTEWWLAFPGNTSFAASSSRANSIFVTNAVGATATRKGTHWLLHASFAPVRGQVVRVQVRTASGWRTVSKTVLRTRTMTYTVGSGRYRVWVAAVKGLLDGYAYVAAR